MTKVLWIGDWASTGFGRASEALCTRLVDLGHEVHVLAVNFRGDSKPGKVALYMAAQKDRNDIYGYSRVLEVLAAVAPDVVVMFNDPFILTHYLFRNVFDPDMILLKYRPIITYQPRDGLSGPVGWQALREVKADGKPFPVSRQIAMSKFGQDQMPGSELAYHGVDTDTFHPVSSQRPVTVQGKRVTSKREAKEALGYAADSFLVLRVDANSWRKDFASTWKALVPVMKRHPDMIAHFHTSKTNPAGGGVQMPDLFTRDVETANRFRLPKEFSDYAGWTTEDLVGLYNAADLFVSTSQGEGFGLTLAESLACGTPVIAQNVSAIPEVVGPGGILIEPGWPVTAPGGQDMFAADVPAFSAAIESMYQNAGFRKRYAKAGIEHVSHFSWDDAAAVFDRAIREEHAASQLPYANEELADGRGIEPRRLTPATA